MTPTDTERLSWYEKNHERINYHFGTGWFFLTETFWKRFDNLRDCIDAAMKEGK